jgi:hypothetical protein
MAKDNTKYLILGGALVAAVYFLTRKQQQVQPPQPAIAQQQLLQWAQTQQQPSVVESIIKNLDVGQLIDFWKDIFGKKDNESDYSGGGDDNGGYWV